jgi:hemerythrin
MESGNTLRWTDALSIGNPHMDKEHVRIIELYNKLADGINKGLDRRQIAEILSGMFDYSLFHFKHEELYMKLIEYPELDAHKEQHKAYILHVSQLNANFFSPDSLEPEAILTFLGNWWRNHIQKTDIQYEVYKQAHHPELDIDWERLWQS